MRHRRPQHADRHPRRITPSPIRRRATALKWVVHLVGDLHQPLHAGEHADSGGNDVKLSFDGRPTNLHSLWDSGLLLAYGESEADLVGQIMASIKARRDIERLRAAR